MIKLEIPKLLHIKKIKYLEKVVLKSLKRFNSEWKRPKKNTYSGDSEVGKEQIKLSAGINQAGRGEAKINKNGGKLKEIMKKKFMEKQMQ